MSTACPQASNHEGNKEAAKGGRPNPIVSPAEGGDFTIRYPHHHLMTQWNKNEQYMGRLGRLGDAVGFASLPTSVQWDERGPRRQLKREGAETVGSERSG